MSGLDATEIGKALVTVAMISRLLGHTDLTCTARDYLAPHILSGAVPPPREEMLFVICALTGGHPVTEEEAIALLQHVELPELG
jgi:hypothetical protein